jgi:hypothetical protein
MEDLFSRMIVRIETDSHGRIDRLLNLELTESKYKQRTGKISLGYRK